MNDDKLNELIARHKSEVVIFREMDIQRNKDALECWHARGKRGNPPASHAVLGVARVLLDRRSHPRIF